MKTTFIKSLVAAIAITSSLGAANIVKAATADQLYSNAHNAIASSISQKTQTSINNARTAIEALRGTAASFAIGEFSKQVDKVEQSKINSCIELINSAKASVATSDIYKAREALNELLTITYNQRVLNYVNQLNDILNTIK